MPWPAWLSWLSIVPQIKRMLVQFPVRAHGLCAWSLGGVHEKGNQSIFLSFSFSLPFPLSKNKEIKSLKIIIVNQQ